MEDKLTNSSDMLFANVLNNILSDNSNLVKNLIFLLWIASETEQLKNDIHSSAASYDLIRNIFLKALFIAKCKYYTAARIRDNKPLQKNCNNEGPGSKVSS